MNKKIRTVLIDDESDFRTALADLLKNDKACICSGEFKTAEQAVEQMPKLKADVAIVNTHLPSMSGIELINRMMDECPTTQWMICSEKEDTETIFAALKAGAKSYVLKKEGIAKVYQSIIELHNGGAPLSNEVLNKIISSIYQKKILNDALTKRENQILNLLAEGNSYMKISENLFISIDTVRTHTQHIYKKLNVKSRTAAVLKVKQAKILT